ncbi:MAG: hypothetical protein ACRD1Z_13205, partial [Vicinamibacteria bacterium]
MCEFRHPTRLTALEGHEKNARRRSDENVPSQGIDADGITEQGRTERSCLVLHQDAASLAS